VKRSIEFEVENIFFVYDRLLLILDEGLIGKF
jgi:hypothetical protein